MLDCVTAFDVQFFKTAFQKGKIGKISGPSLRALHRMLEGKISVFLLHKKLSICCPADMKLVVPILKLKVSHRFEVRSL